MWGAEDISKEREESLREEVEGRNGRGWTQSQHFSPYIGSDRIYRRDEERWTTLRMLSSILPHCALTVVAHTDCMVWSHEPLRYACTALWQIWNTFLNTAATTFFSPMVTSTIQPCPDVLSSCLLEVSHWDLGLGMLLLREAHISG